MRINYNVSSIIARNALNNNDKRVAASMRRLTSGHKISNAADNAAGLAIARRMNAQINSLQQANQNANDGLSAMNTVDGALSEMHDILQRMNELAIQSANGTNSASDREMIQKEIDQLVAEADRIAKTTQFNAQNLLDGSFALKGFTNSENVKVMSYSESVNTGTYAIGKLTYYHYEDTVTKWEINERKITDPDNKKVVNVTYEANKVAVTRDSHFEIDDMGEQLKNSLVTGASIAQYETTGEDLKAFPDESMLTLENDVFVIRADNNFEVKVKVNDRMPLGRVNTTTVQAAGAAVGSIVKEYDKSVTGSSVVTTTSYSAVTKYRNIAVKGPDGKRYSFKELNFFANVDSNGKPLMDGSDKIYTRFADDRGKDLTTDLAEYFKDTNPNCSIDIEEVKYDAGTETFTVKYSALDGRTGVTTTGNTAEFSFYKDINDFGAEMETQRTLDDYKYSETFTTRTKYEVGKGEPEDCLKFDLTGMGSMVVHVGANFGHYLELEVPALTAEHLGIEGLDITTEESARLAIGDIGDAINRLSAVRAKIGAYSNRLERTITNLDTAEENITSTYSHIMDVDMATEMTEYSSSQILVQASTSMLAQANERPQQVLQLLQ